MTPSQPFPGKTALKGPLHSRSKISKPKPKLSRPVDSVALAKALLNPLDLNADQLRDLRDYISDELVQKRTPSCREDSPISSASGSSTDDALESETAFDAEDETSQYSENPESNEAASDLSGPKEPTNQEAYAAATSSAGYLPSILATPYLRREADVSAKRPSIRPSHHATLDDAHYYQNLNASYQGYRSQVSAIAPFAGIPYPNWQHDYHPAQKYCDMKHPFPCSQGFSLMPLQSTPYGPQSAPISDEEHQLMYPYGPSRPPLPKQPSNLDRFSNPYKEAETPQASTAFTDPSASMGAWLNTSKEYNGYPIAISSSSSAASSDRVETESKKAVSNKHDFSNLPAWAKFPPRGEWAASRNLPWPNAAKKERSLLSTDPVDHRQTRGADGQPLRKRARRDYSRGASNKRT